MENEFHKHQRLVCQGRFPDVLSLIIVSLILILGKKINEPYLLITVDMTTCHRALFGYFKKDFRVLKLK